ncbi:MAG: alpha/beta fold hydrolase [Actinomycetota bacterium]
MLASDTLGSGRRVALLHGFTQTRRCWNGLDELLSQSHEVVRVDLPGHGEAGPVGRPLEETADLLADEVGAAIWVGYSMGGRHALRVAVDHPEVVEGLVTIGATAGIETEAERAERRALDAQRASALIVQGVADFLDEWMRLPLFAGLPPEAAHRDERLGNTVEGLASSLVVAGTGMQAPMWGDLRGAEAPAAFVVGGRDEKFAALAQRLDDAWGGPSRVRTVAGAGHAAHLEDPAAVAAIIDHLSRVAA